jgi:hypothetical protein
MHQFSFFLSLSHTYPSHTLSLTSPSWYYSHTNSDKCSLSRTLLPVTWTHKYVQYTYTFKHSPHIGNDRQTLTLIYLLTIKHTHTYVLSEYFTFLSVSLSKILYFSCLLSRSFWLLVFQSSSLSPILSIFLFVSIWPSLFHLLLFAESYFSKGVIQIIRDTLRSVTQAFFSF